MSRIKDLYTLLLITNRPAYVDGWLAAYQAFTSDVAKVRAALKEGKEIRSKAAYEATSFNAEIDPWPAFAKRLLKDKHNGIASAGQSTLDNKNLPRFIGEPEFVQALTELIKQPDKDNFIKFGEAWERTRKKCHANRNPLLVNRTVAACTTNVTSAAKDAAFESVYQWLVREGFIPQLPDHKAGWYDKNIQVMVFLRESFAEELRKGETNEHLLSIFVWQIYQNMKKQDIKYDAPGTVEAPANLSDSSAPLPPATKFTRADALAGLFMSSEGLETIISRLERKKALILSGPPGVGKTFIARLLAYTIMGEQDSRRVAMVQFHPSYGYEDFIQGFRPNQTGLVRRNGVLYQFAKLAQQDPAKKWFFVIDEINRGNLAKIFGELLMLIESDKRGPANAIPLTYSERADETFYLPQNLYFIGTMNTADRSLAMVDYALRRRFAFAPMEPALDSQGFAKWLRERAAAEPLIERIRSKIGRLNEIIKEERDLGPGFRIGHSYFCPTDGNKPDDTWYREVIHGEIRPLLEEYFDSREKVNDLVADLLA